MEVPFAGKDVLLKKRVKITSLLLSAAMLAVSLSGCNSAYAKFEQKTYDCEIANIGQSRSSDHVLNLSNYASVEEYMSNDEEAEVIWVDDTVLEKEAQSVNELISSGKRVLVITKESAGDILNVLGSQAQIPVSVEGDVAQVGLLFDGVAGEESADCVVLYAAEADESQVDFFGFCSSYDFAGKYQGSSMLTSRMEAVKMKDVFAAYNFAEESYAVSYGTIVDYMDNPSYSNDIFLDEYVFKFLYTICTFSEVIPINEKTSGITSTIAAGDSGYVVNTCPDMGFEFDANTTDTRHNFLYDRYIDVASGFFDEGQVITLEKGYRAENASWQIVTMNNKTDKLKYSYGAQNLTAAADFTNTTGHYLPKISIEITTGEGDEQCVWSASMSIDEWAFVWEGEYDE